MLLKEHKAYKEKTSQKTKLSTRQNKNLPKRPGVVVRLEDQD